MIIELLQILADPGHYAARWNKAGELELVPKDQLPPNARLIDRRRKP
jgi:hypothetical protein